MHYDYLPCDGPNCEKACDLKNPALKETYDRLVTGPYRREFHFAVPRVLSLCE
jgi:hypothetical protein